MNSHIQALEFRHVLLENVRQIQQPQVSLWLQRSDEDFILSSRPALVNANVDILRSVQHWETGRVKSPLAC